MLSRAPMTKPQNKAALAREKGQMCPTLMKNACSHKFSSTKQKHDATLLGCKTQTQSRTRRATLVSWCLHVLSQEPCIGQIAEIITFVARANLRRRQTEEGFGLKLCQHQRPADNGRSTFCRIPIAQGGPKQKSGRLSLIESSNTVPSKTLNPSTPRDTTRATSTMLTKYRL